MFSTRIFNQTATYLAMPGLEGEPALRLPGGCSLLFPAILISRYPQGIDFYGRGWQGFKKLANPALAISITVKQAFKVEKKNPQ